MNSATNIERLPLIAPRFKPQTSRERRATVRLALEVEVEELVGEARYFFITHDLSTFGLSTRQGIAHRPGTRLTLRLHLPDALPPLEVAAEVVGELSRRGGMRLAFRKLSAEAGRRIHRYVLSRARLAG